MTPKKPLIIDKKFVRQVLHQAFGSDEYRPTGVWGEAWCLSEYADADVRALIAHMRTNGLIEESGEPGFDKMTEKGSRVLNENRDY